ncbi:MAG: hypothetical protein ACUVWR_16705 [Anaerolineae bacterium]
MAQEIISGIVAMHFRPAKRTKICELVTAAFTYEGLSLAIYDQPDLVQEVTERIVEEFHRLYGDRIASLGGVDVDILARGSVEDVRRRTRQIIDACAPLGRFAIGSGNSIPNYVPLANYLAMLEEALV